MCTRKDVGTRTGKDDENACIPGIEGIVQRGAIWRNNTAANGHVRICRWDPVLFVWLGFKKGEKSRVGDFECCSNLQCLAAAILLRESRRGGEEIHGCEGLDCVLVASNANIDKGRLEPN